jgi:hypothetical protein
MARNFDPGESMRSWYRSGAVAIAVMFLSTLGLGQYTPFLPQSQTPSNTKAPRCTVSGVVVNSLTGEAIPRAQVMLYGSEARNSLTDSEGKFTFEDVVQATVGVMANKPGFTSHPNRSVNTRVQVCAANSSDAIKILLMPAAAIVGRITDANGDPVDEIPVRVGKYVYSEGRRRFNVAGGGMTDYEGRFRLANIDAGSYVLIVGPSTPQMLVAIRDVTPVTYYPGVPDRNAAAMIDVKAGATVDASMVVREVKGYTVSGRVVGLSAEPRGISLQFTNQSGDDIGTMMGRRQGPNEFLVAGVPAGNYLVRATAFEQGGGAITGTAQVAVAHDVSNLQVSLSPPFNLAVSIRDEGVGSTHLVYSSPQGTVTGDTSLGSLRLTNYKEEGQDFYATPEGAKTLKWVVKNVQRGTYVVEVSPSTREYVQSARLGGVDLLREPVTIDSDQDPIEITFRDDGAELSGTIDGSETAIVVAIPSSGALFPPKTSAYFANEGATGARFQMILAPGDYTLYAIETDGIEYTNPKVMEKYASQGVHVSVSAKEKKEVTLKLVEAAP